MKFDRLMVVFLLLGCDAKLQTSNVPSADKDEAEAEVPSDEPGPQDPAAPQQPPAAPQQPPATTQPASWVDEIGIVDVMEDAPLAGIAARAPSNTLRPFSYSFDLGRSTCDDGTWSPPPAIDPVTGALSGTPTNSDVGTCSLEILAVHGTEVLTQIASIRIANTNDLPEWTTEIPDFTIDAEDAVTGRTAAAADIDPSASIVYAIDGAQSSCDDGSWTPALAIDPSTGALSGTPSRSDVGKCTVTTVASSGADELESTFEITVGAIDGESLITPNDAFNAFSPAMVWTGTQLGMVYYDQRNGADDVFFARAGAGGVRIGVETQISPTDAFISRDPEIFWTGSEFAVIYHDNRSGSYNIYFQRVSTNGAKLGSELRISTAHSSLSSLVWNGTEYAVFFTDNSLGDTNLFMQRIDANSAFIGSAIRLTPDDTNDAGAAQAVWTGTEYGLVFQDKALGDNNIYFTRVSSIGAKIGTESLLTIDDTRNAYWPSIKWTGTEFGVSYTDSRGIGYWELLFRRINADGTLNGSEAQVTPSDTGSADYISMTWNDSEFGFAYTDSRTGEEDVWVARVSATGNILSEVRISPVDGVDASNVFLATSGSDYAVIYDDPRPDWNDNNVFMARVDSSGTFSGEVALTPTDTSYAEAWGVTWMDGRYAAIYLDERVGVGDIYVTLKE